MKSNVRQFELGPKVWSLSQTPFDIFVGALFTRAADDLSLYTVELLLLDTLRPTRRTSKHDQGPAPLILHSMCNTYQPARRTCVIACVFWQVEFSGLSCHAVSVHYFGLRISSRSGSIGPTKAAESSQGGKLERPWGGSTCDPT